MKIHPIPQKKLNKTLIKPPIPPRKILHRLPHIFAKVLELPFHVTTDVSVEETPSSLRFTVSDTDVPPGAVADTVEIHPGVTKIVVRLDDVCVVDLGFGLDLWRFRLPESTRPELAYVVVDAGDLIVVVPKDGDIWNDDSGFVIVN